MYIICVKLVTKHILYFTEYTNCTRYFATEQSQQHDAISSNLNMLTSLSNDISNLDAECRISLDASRDVRALIRHISSQGNKGSKSETYIYLYK